MLLPQKWTPHGRRRLGGRVLSEFLVALALLFLALVPNLAILHSATRNGEQSALSARALALLREGIEQVTGEPAKYKGRVTADKFGSGIGGPFEDEFERRISLLPDKKTGLLLATVVVKWSKGSHEAVLERYVRAD